jgi:hypothetical protein
MPSGEDQEMMTQEEYLKDYGKCPRCRSASIEGLSNMKSDADYAYQNLECLDCGLLYDDLYQLKEYIIISE